MAFRRAAIVTLTLASASLVAAQDRVALLINGEGVTKSEFEALMRELRGPAAQTSGVPDSLRPLPAIVEAVEYLAVVQAARQSGFLLNDNQFEQLVANMRERRGLASEEQLATALKREAVSLDALRRRFERQMAWYRLRLDVLSRSQVADAEAREYYDSHRSEFALSSFEQARDQIVRSLSTPERDAQAWDAYVKSARAQAVIEWRDEQLRRAYELAIGLR